MRSSDIGAVLNCSAHRLWSRRSTAPGMCTRSSPVNRYPGTRPISWHDVRRGRIRYGATWSTWESTRWRRYSTSSAPSFPATKTASTSDLRGKVRWPHSPSQPKGGRSSARRCCPAAHGRLAGHCIRAPAPERGSTVSRTPPASSARHSPTSSHPIRPGSRRPRPGGRRTA